MLFEVFFIYYNLKDDALFVSLVKFIAVCCILASFLSIANHRNPCIEFDGMLSDTYKYSTEYKYFTEMNAYKQYERYNGKECGICLDEFNFNRSNNVMSLLFCGHLFHKTCIEQNENYNWNHTQICKPYAKCPLCRCKYNVTREKYQFNTNYWDSIHPLQRKLPSYCSFTNFSEL